MKSPNDLTESFLQQRQVATPPPHRTPINAFNALFAIQDLSERENRIIERIFVEEGESKEDVQPDVVEIKRLTKEIKAIQKQEKVFVGERIAQARQIFKKYKERRFREWLRLTFGSFKTGYNYLSYYDFYSILPLNLQGTFKEMPAKIAYILASKRAPLENKVAIVKDYGEGLVSDLLLLIQETLSDGQTLSIGISPMEKIFLHLERETAQILLCKKRLTEAQQQRIRSIIVQLETLFE